MTFFSDTLAGQQRPSFLAGLGARIVDVFDRMVAFQSRDIAVQQLQAMSDQQLAEMGIARKDILRHVYRDVYYV